MENPPTPPPIPQDPAVFARPRQRPSTKLSNEKKERYKKAWIDVKEGRFNVYQAAKHYDLKQPTLWHWCQRTNVDGATPSVGRPCFLGSKLENNLKKWILEASSSGNSYLNKHCLQLYICNINCLKNNCRFSDHSSSVDI